MSEFSVGDPEGVEHSPLRIRFGSKTRTCIHCGNTTKRIIKNCEKKFKRIKRFFRFCCSECKKETSPWTQIDYEDNEKRLSKIYNCLLKYAKSEQIKKIWVDHSNNILEYAPALENLRGILFLVVIDETEFKIPCSYTVKLNRYYESPVSVKKDKNCSKALADLKRRAKRDKG